MRYVQELSIKYRAVQLRCGLEKLKFLYNESANKTRPNIKKVKIRKSITAKN